MDYGISTTVRLPFDKAVKKVTDELKKEGFGVLTTIDLKEAFASKLGINFKNYTILGACNPPFAHQALQADENIGLLLPCNVIVHEAAEGTVVGAFNPLAMLSLVENPAIIPLAQELKARLERVIGAVA